MDERSLHDDLLAISEWADPVSVPDPDHLDAHTVGDHDGAPRPGDAGRRVLLAAAAVLLVIGGVWVLTGRDDPATVAPTPTSTSPSTSTPDSTDPAGGSGWVETPPGPLLPRADAQVLWTGTEFVVFAGTDQAPCPVCDYASYGNTLHDAAAYDPATNTWRTIADLPDASSYIGTSAVVDGDVFWLSVRDPSTNSSGIDATLQRWSSTNDTWTEIALPAEVPGNPRLAGVLMSGLVLYPGTDEVGAFPDQLWAAGSWTTLPDDPLGPSYDRQIVDGGDAVILFAKSLTEAQNTATPSLVQGASLFSGTWETIPVSDQLYTPMTRLGDALYAPFGGGADGGEVGNWGRTVPNGGSYALDTHTWSAFPATTPEDLMGVVSSDGTAVLGVKGHVLHADAGSYSVIPTLPDGLGDQFGQAIANGDGTVFTFGGGLGNVRGGPGVHGRGFVWRPGADPEPPSGDPAALDRALAILGIDPAGAPSGSLDLAGGTFCGYEVNTLDDSSQHNETGRSCFADALDRRAPAIFIEQLVTTEGQPVATVWRTVDGRGIYSVDETREALGSRAWRIGECVLAPTNGAVAFVCVDNGIDVNPTPTT